MFKTKPITVEYWLPSKRFGAHNRRKFDTEEEARMFMSRMRDDGYESQMWVAGKEHLLGDTFTG